MIRQARNRNDHRWATALLAIALVAGVTGAAAEDTREVEGVELASSIAPEWHGERLVLNGVGAYRRLFWRVYVVALYLPEPSRSAAEVMAAVERPKRVQLVFTHRALSADQLLDAWERAAAERLEGRPRDAMERALAKHREAFAVDVEAGDVVVYDYHPERGTRIALNGEAIAHIDDGDWYRAFHQGLLAFWLGDEPVSDGLKAGLLGAR